MQINLETYRSDNFTCLCGWNGKGAQLAIENISEMHWIVDFECPKCGEHIGSGQSRLTVPQDKDSENMGDLNKPILVFEVAGAGEISRIFKKFDITANVFIFYSEIEKITNVQNEQVIENRKLRYFNNFMDCLIALVSERPQFYSQYPIIIDKDLIEDLMSFLKTLKNNKEHCDYYRSWSDIIDMPVEVMKSIIK